MSVATIGRAATAARATKTTTTAAAAAAKRPTPTPAPAPAPAPAAPPAAPSSSGRSSGRARQLLTTAWAGRETPGQSAAGLIVGLLVWGWVILPLIRGGPPEVKKTLAAKFLNKGPDGKWLP